MNTDCAKVRLVVAGVGKIQNLSAFVQGLRYQVLPTPLARWYGLLLPMVEIGAGALLFLGIWIRPAAVVSMALFASFAIAVGLNLARKREMPCFCFGADAADKMGWHTLTRILPLLLFAIVLALAPFAPDPLQSMIRDPSLAGLVNLVPIALLSLFGLSMLSLVEISPWVIRAWTAPGVRPAKQAFSVVWTRERETQEGTEK